MPRAASIVVLAVAVLIGLWGFPNRAALANWTFGPEYLARIETYEYRNAWYLRHVYWRAAYFSGVYQFPEFVRNVDVYQGPIVAYGPATLASQSVEYCSPPHASSVTRYHRPVYLYGEMSRYEELPDMIRVEDACSVLEGQAFAQDAQVADIGGTLMLRITYSYPIYHSNAAYGTFLVGYGQRQELAPFTGGGAAAPSSAPYIGTVSQNAAYLDVALRQLESVEGFADYALVASSTYAQDIKEAFDLGLIVGKYDDTQRYFDPNAPITTGEMLNVLARNLGAASTVQGLEAAAYLSGLGVRLPTALDGALTLTTLETLAIQIIALDQVPKADLLVIRQVLDGTLAANIDGSISRAYAVAMYRPATEPAAGSVTVVPPGTSSQGGGEAQHAAPVTSPPASQTPPLIPPDTLWQQGYNQPAHNEVIFVLSD